MWKALRATSIYIFDTFLFVVNSVIWLIAIYIP
jgi:hypothetical protein